MTPLLNARARLERAQRNNVKIESASETFRRFKWFYLGMSILLPVYPSLAFLGTDTSAHASDYDDSTIITAYSEVGDGGYMSNNGLISSDFVLSPPDSGLPSGENIARTDEISPVRKSPSIIQYSVQAGDTLAKISDRYDVSVDAIVWANDMSPSDTLKPGMSLKIPPISGVIHKVAKGDTLGGIALRYSIDVDDIIRVNSISDVTAVRIGRELIIPGAVKKTESVTKKNLAVNTQTSSQKTPIAKTPTSTKAPTVNPSGLQDRYTVKYTGLSRGFAPGNCTWYVAQNKTVTWRGNANQWLKNAKAAGVKTGQTPVPGSIVQLSGRGYNRYYGHVGIVADVTDDHIIIKDMNYRGLYEVTIRKIPRNDATIDGYIYVN